MAGHETEALFGEFFRDAAVASRALTAYPGGHPAVSRSIARAHASLEALLGDVGPFGLGAARDGLLWGTRRFAAPAAAQLARLLRRRRAAGLAADPGATAGELETLLRSLAVDARTARSLGSLAAELRQAGLARIRVVDLDFGAVGMVPGEEEPAAPEAGSLPARAVQRLVERGSIPRGELDRWLARGGTLSDLLQFLLESRAQPGVPGEWVAPAAEAAARVVDELGKADAGGRGAAAPEPGAPPRAVDPSQAAALRRAFATADLDALREQEALAPSLEALLQAGSEAPLPGLDAAATGIARALSPAEATRPLVAGLLELADRHELDPARRAPVLARVEAGCRKLLAAGGIRDVAAFAEQIARGASAGGARGEAFRASRAALSSRDAMVALAEGLALASEGVRGSVPELVARLDPAAVDHLLDVLAGAEDRALRLLLLEALGRLGPVIARGAEARLSDPRWYVVRNMLQLLRRVGDARSVPAVRRCVQHADLRVRLEAIHNLFAFDDGVPRQLLRKAIHDPDPRQAEAAMELAGKYEIAEAVEPIVEYLANPDPLGRRRAARLEGIRALAAIRDPRALDGLESFGARFRLVRPAVEERRELYRTLAVYPPEARRPFVERGLRSGDAEIRRLAGLLARAEDHA